VSAQVGGQISEVLAEEGERVEAGRVIVRIDPERRRLALHSQRARVVGAEAEVSEGPREQARIEQLRSRNAVSESQLDTARTQLRLGHSRLEAARAQLGLAERALRDSEVLSPFTGFIARRKVSRGEYVSAGDELFDLVALDPIEIEFHLAEGDSGRVALGNPVTLRVAPYPDTDFEAQVTAISPTIDSLTRTLRVKAELANPEGRLRPGLFARVDLGISERLDVPMVPEEAVLQRADGSVVFRLVSDERVERINVRLGVHRDGNVEVAQGLKPGDRVVVRGQAELMNGSVISLRDPDGTPAVSGSPE
jgi:membrane fusion protein (multidrug efflux system)